MAVASWMISNQRMPKNIRPRYINRDEDVYKLDFWKKPAESTLEILQGLYMRNGDKCCALQFSKQTPTSLSEQNSVPITKASQKTVSDSKRLSYLNAIVELLSKDETKHQLGFTTEELMCCLRVSLVDEVTHVRAAALRALRYLLKTESDVATFNALRLPYLVIRCMDVVLRNEVERAQALRVVRRAIAVACIARTGKFQISSLIEPGLLRCLAAVASSGVAAADGINGDRLSRACIATLAEIGVLNPPLFVWCGGVSAVTRYLLECPTPRMAEALCGVLLHTLDSPASRIEARIDLRCLAAPYCDFHYRHGWLDKNRDERERRFTCSRLSLLSVLRSWPGLLHFCDPLDESGLRAIVHVLYLNQLEVRKAVLDLLYELLGLPQPEWTDEISVALSAVDPSDFQDSWRLNEGFVAAEGRAILPHLSATGPDITEIHLALLLYCFLEAGLLEGLAEVIVTSDTFISVRATVLLGQLLHLLHMLLPAPLVAAPPALPALLAHAAAGHHHALAALAALQRLHALLHARPASSSLFLDHIVQYCAGAFLPTSSAEPAAASRIRTISESSEKCPSVREESSEQCQDEFEIERRVSFGSKSESVKRNDSIGTKSRGVIRTSSVVSKVAKSTKLFNLFERDSDSLLKDSNVLQNKDGLMWKWCIIRAILKERCSGKPLLQLSEGVHRAWARRLVHYLRPSANRFSHADLTPHATDTTRAACQLIRILLRDPDIEAHRLLEELFSDVSGQVAAIAAARSAHECLFSPQHMSNTMCQLYFLFVGQLCHCSSGLQLFHDTGLYTSLLQLSTTTPHGCYVKLIISSLDYTLNSYPREILVQTLICNIEASRLYATQFLNVLLRATQKSTEMLRNKDKLSYVCTQTSQNGNTDASSATKPSDNYIADMETWILELLVKQIQDESKTVLKCALSILDEACSVPSYLERLVGMREAIWVACGLRTGSIVVSSEELARVGDRGYLLWLRIEVAAAAVPCPTRDQLLIRQIEFWNKSYNFRYVRLVESWTHEALTLHGAACAEGGRARRAAAPAAPGRRPARPPPHLYAHLALHPRGLHLLATHAHLTHIVGCILEGRCGTEQEVVQLKSVLWAAGAAGSSAQGLELVQAAGNALGAATRLAATASVYSVRAAAFYVLALFGSTYAGANLLYEMGWLCVRHTRHDRFPIIKEENWISKMSTDDDIFKHLYASPYKNLNVLNLDIETSETSERTDASIAESYHSDKSGGKHITTLALKQQSVVEEFCDSNDVMEEKLDPTDTDTRTSSESSDKVDKRLKSQTLPQRLYPGFKKHQRSLSESKTVDKLKIYEDTTDSTHEKPFSFQIGPISETRPLIGRMNSFEWQDGLRRIRNNSESSTSGVSSCDSVYGKYVLNDRFLTLSPIPSSSSLSAMKGQPAKSRPLDTQRRISLQSYTVSDAASSPPSHRDMIGYATLKSLTRHRRPHVSESAAGGVSAMEELLVSGSRRNTFGSLRERTRASQERISKLSLLKYDWKPLAWPDEGATDLFRESIDCTGSTLRRNPPCSNLLGDGPCYRGVALPADLLRLFPRCTTDEVDLADTSFNATDSKFASTSRDSDRSSALRRGGVTWWNWPDDVDSRRRHEPASCLQCARHRPASAAELREAFFAGMDSPNLGPQGTVAGNITQTSLDVSCSPTSLESSFSKNSEGNCNISTEVLKHAERMGNPLWIKQSQQSLLSLKQKYPETFQSVCLYSDVCKLMSHGTYRVSARRFLQELFLDTSFECFYTEPLQIIQSRLSDFKPPLSE